jgi:glucokinase
LEAYVSATALIRDTKRAAEQERSSLLWRCAANEGAFSGRTAFEAAKMGDAVAQRVVDRYVFYLAVGLVNIIRIFQPEVTLVGGGISNAGDALFLPLTRAVEDMIRHDGVPKEKQTKIRPAARGNDAGIIGAAFLGRK